MSKHAGHLLFVNPDNPDNRLWFEIRGEAGDLIKRMDNIKLRLLDIKSPKLFPFKFKKDLNKLQRVSDELLPIYEKWRVKARGFCENPQIHVDIKDMQEHPSDRIFIQLHFFGIIRDSISNIEERHNSLIRDLQMSRIVLNGIRSQFVAGIFFTVSILISITLTLIRIASPK